MERLVLVVEGPLQGDVRHPQLVDRLGLLGCRRIYGPRHLACLSNLFTQKLTFLPTETFILESNSNLASTDLCR